MDDYHFERDRKYFISLKFYKRENFICININITCASHEKRKMAKVVSKTSKTSGAFAKTFLRQMEGGAQHLQMFPGESE